MDKVTKVIEEELESMCEVHRNSLEKLSTWQLDSSLPVNLRKALTYEKIDFLVEVFKMKHPIYKLLNDDKILVKEGKASSYNDLKLTKVDPRFLESFGLSERQIDDYYRFVERIKSSF